ncbi:MAG: hypothetical protein V1913_00840 [Fibrobacterota bacterium]
METLTVKCPCCKAVLTLSQDLGTILHCEEFKKGPAEFNNFLQKQKSRKEDLERKFEASKEKSQSRLKTIEEKIELAKRRDTQE